MKIGIIGAMETEVSALKEAMKVDRIITKAGMNFYEGNLEGAQAVVVQCGVGKVNAAMCVQILADLFHVTHILNTGVAGSLNADLDIGDILVSKKRSSMMWMSARWDTSLERYQGLRAGSFLRTRKWRMLWQALAAV